MQGFLIADRFCTSRYDDESVADEEEDETEEDEDGHEGSGLTPLLPIFEAAQLGRSPRMADL